MILCVCQAHVQDDLNRCILHMLEGTFSIDLTYLRQANNYFSVYPPPDILSGLRLDVHASGDLKISRPSSGFLA